MAGHGLGDTEGNKRAPKQTDTISPDSSTMVFFWLLSCFALVGAAYGKCWDLGSPDLENVGRKPEALIIPIARPHKTAWSSVPSNG